MEDRSFNLKCISQNKHRKQSSKQLEKLAVLIGATRKWGKRPPGARARSLSGGKSWCQNDSGSIQTMGHIVALYSVAVISTSGTCTCME